MSALRPLVPTLAILALLFLFTFTVRPNADRTFHTRPEVAAGAATLVVIALLYLGTGASPFLYYQF